MLVALTGTPGVGKSSVAEELRRRGYRVVSVAELAREHGCILEENDELVVDVEKIREVEFDGIVEGHLAHFMDADVVIVLRCDPLVLKERLAKRKWDYDKIMDNVEAELLDVILVESLEMHENVYEIDVTHMSVEEVADAVEKIIAGEGEKFKPGKVDWLSKYEDRLREVARL
ncbi:MAG: adenylate kinase family protein [Archaeoglobaceae archaeon]